MEVNSICRGYRSYNEDVVAVIKDHLFVVIDAATALCEPRHQPNDGVFLAEALKKEILDLYRSNKLKPKNFEKQMNNVSKKLYKVFIKGNKDLKERYQFPNAGVAVIYIDVCDVHVFSIGDVSSFIKMKNGKARYISDKTIPIMDREVVKYYHSIGINQFDEMYEKLRYNRSLLNKGGRRAVFSLYKKPHLKFKHEVFDIRELNEAYICSDGYYEAFETFKLFKSRRALFDSKNDLQDVYRKIVETAQKDKDMSKYPRLKLIDDISCVRVVF